MKGKDLKEQIINEELDLRILLVEDDIESGKAIDAALALNDINVKWVTSAEEALGIFDMARYDAVVTDIRLGGASGVELLKEIRKSSTEYPVILLTGYSDIDAAIGAVKLGAQGYITKPLEDIDELIDPLRKAVRLHKTLLKNEELRKENKAHYEQLKYLGNELILAEENERRKLAVDLHDSIAQILTSSMMQLDMAVESDDDPMAYMQSAREKLAEAVERTRSLTLKLSSPVLYTCGLNAALEELVERIEKEFNLKIQVNIGKHKSDLSEKSSVLLFRTARELLTNIVKHAEATKVELSVASSDDELRIDISDNGKGFLTEEIWGRKNGNHGIGLFSIRERISALGGRFEMESEPGNGTRATVVVPLLEPTSQ